MTSTKAIMALFTSHEVVLRPSEIIRRTGLRADTARKSLRRLVAKQWLFNIAHAQYTTSPSTKPITRRYDTRVEQIEARLADALARIEKLERYNGFREIPAEVA